jgi:hypothetical protein
MLPRIRRGAARLPPLLSLVVVKPGSGTPDFCTIGGKNSDSSLGTLPLVLGPTKQAACPSTVHGGAGSGVWPLASAAPIFLSLARDGRRWE